MPSRLAMPTSGYWPEKTRCRLGGYGAGRTEGCLARAQQSGTSTAKTKRTFHTEQDIVAALRASLSAFEDDDGVRLTPPEVDRTLVGVVELAPEALQAVLALRELVARATRIALRRAVEDVAFADDVRGCPETVPVGA